MLFLRITYHIRNQPTTVRMKMTVADVSLKMLLSLPRFKRLKLPCRHEQNISEWLSTAIWSRPHVESRMISKKTIFVR